MSTLAELRKKRAQIYKIAKKYSVSNIRVFGSVARGEDGKRSDIDLLVDVDYKKYGSGFARVDFKANIEKFLHKQVDVVTLKSLHQTLKSEILQETKPL